MPQVQSRPRPHGRGPVLLCLLLLALAAPVLGAPVLAAQAQEAKGLPGGQEYRPADGSFSLRVPAGWSVSQAYGRAAGGDHELVLRAPDKGFLDYGLFTLRLVTAPHKSPERCLALLEKPRHAAAPLARREAASLAGKPAWRVVLRSTRGLAGYTGQIPAVSSSIVLPLDSGYFVLSADLPEAREAELGPAVAAMLESFVPHTRGPQPGPLATRTEEALMAAFFASGGRPATGEGPPYLAETARQRSIAARTRQAPAPPEALRRQFAALCGAPDALFEDYEAKRGQQVAISDRMATDRLDVVAEEREGTGAVSPRMAMERLSRPLSGLMGETLRFSRAGVAPDGDSALLYVDKFGSSPGTSYFLLLRRVDGQWGLCAAGLDEMRIY